MRQYLAALMLLLFGLAVPFGAESARLCLLENRILISASEECTASTKCCDDCEVEVDKTVDAAHHGDACCLEVKKIPDSTLPSGPDKIPAFYAVEIPEESFTLTANWQAAEEDGFELSEETLALPPPSMRRAILGVWTI